MFCRLRNRLSIPTIRRRKIFYILAAVLATVPGLAATIQRQDFLISGGAGHLHVREVRIAEVKGARNVLLVHGGGPGGVASFDLPFRGYSLAEDLARNGFRVFIMDVRG
jgi:alpha-beta hydrolase superfamily lysophospholipase